MKKTKFLAAFTAFTLAMSFIGCDIATSEAVQEKLKETKEEKEREKQEVVEFGSYPQSKKADSVTISGGPETENGWECYTGSDGAKYINFNSVYYKIEPIKWKKITSDYEGTEKALYFSETILDYTMYFDHSCFSETHTRKINGKTAYPANYEYSRLRAFLNGLSYYDDYNATSKTLSTNDEFEGKGFLQKAFNDDERGQIAITPVTVSSYAKNGSASDKTSDKVFVLSKAEVTMEKYHFGDDKATGDESNRVRKTSDYAAAKYRVAFSSSDEEVFNDYWLRTAKENDNMWQVWPGGILTNNLTTNTCGICPAICK